MRRRRWEGRKVKLDKKREGIKEREGGKEKQLGDDEIVGRREKVRDEG